MSLSYCTYFVQYVFTLYSDCNRKLNSDCYRCVCMWGVWQCLAHFVPQILFCECSSQCDHIVPIYLMRCVNCTFNTKYKKSVWNQSWQGNKKHGNRQTKWGTDNYTWLLIELLCTHKKTLFNIIENLFVAIIMKSYKYFNVVFKLHVFMDVIV